MNLFAVLIYLSFALEAALSRDLNDSKKTESQVLRKLDSEITPQDYNARELVSIIPTRVNVPLCSNDQNIFLLFDLSRSLTIKAMSRGDNIPRQFLRQLEYSRAVVGLFDEEGVFDEDTRISITAYTRRMGRLIALTNDDSLEANTLLEKLETSGDDSFFENWDDGDYDNLVRKGNGYTHMGVALKENVGAQLREAQGLGNFPLNSTVILYTDGRPERYRFRNLKNKIEEFELSLEIVQREARLLREEFGSTGIYIHCVVLRRDSFAEKFYQQNEDVCDTVQAVQVRNALIPAQVRETFTFESCGHMPPVPPVPVPTVAPSSSPTTPTPPPGAPSGAAPPSTPSVPPLTSPTPTVAPLGPVPQEGYCMFAYEPDPTVSTDEGYNETALLVTVNENSTATGKWVPINHGGIPVEFGIDGSSGLFSSLSFSGQVVNIYSNYTLNMSFHLSDPVSIDHCTSAEVPFPGEFRCPKCELGLCGGNTFYEWTFFSKIEGSIDGNDFEEFSKGISYPNNECDVKITALQVPQMGWNGANGKNNQLGVSFWFFCDGLPAYGLHTADINGDIKPCNP